MDEFQPEVRMGAAFTSAVLRKDKDAVIALGENVPELLQSLVYFAATMAGTVFGTGDIDAIADGIDAVLRNVGEEWK